jgi:hypothetical protein
LRRKRSSPSEAVSSFSFVYFLLLILPSLIPSCSVPEKHRCLSEGVKEILADHAHQVKPGNRMLLKVVPAVPVFCRGRAGVIYTKNEKASDQTEAFSFFVWNQALTR